MKIGVFDSGLGGLVIARSIRAALPDHDMIYLGDTLNLPYGSRSTDTIYDYTKRAVDWLFRQDCKLVIVACNTASAAALRKIQQGYLRENYPDRRVLGVVVPTLEHALDSGHKRLGLIATNYIVSSDVYGEELQKIDPAIRIVQMNTPLLVPLIENEGEAWLDSVLENYLRPILDEGIDSILLGCTHYALLKDRVGKIVGEAVDVFSQDEIIPLKLLDYLQRHPEIDEVLDRGGQDEFCVTDITQGYQNAAAHLYGRNIELRKVVL